MPSNSPGTSQPSTSSSGSTPPGDFTTLPRGLLCRKGVPVARGARLPSLRTPRDLTLGGATKRTFTPNIPVRREKKDEEIKSASGVSPASSRGRGSRRNQQGERGRGRGRGNNNVIQLQGSVFGEGISVEGGRKKGAFGQSTREDSSGSKSMPVPRYTPNNKSQTKEEKEEEEAKINELLRDDFIDDWDDETSKLKPVQLPLLVKNIKAEADIKPKLEEVKKELLSDDEPEPMEVDGDVKPKIKQEIKQEVKQEVKQEAHVDTSKTAPTAADLFTSSAIPDSGQLLFFQFPDCLPGASGKSDDDSRIKKEPGKSNEASAHQQGEESGSCVLGELPEGFIGKLQVLKSGRTRLMLGPVCLNVELGTPLGFLQDVVSVRVKEDRDPAAGDMFVLGHVQEKLVCLPDMDSLLQNLQKL